MRIQLETENCDYSNPFLADFSADSTIKIRLEIPNLPNIQARKKVRDDVCKLIRTELSKFQWLITGSVTVDFIWYLHAIDRQETDKVGDLDNISKPIQDALTGPAGILIDDAQIRGLYISWMTRNNFVQDNVLQLVIKYNNDFTVNKKNLMFIQYAGSICLPVNYNTSDLKDLFAVQLLIKNRLKLRKVAQRLKTVGANVDRYLVFSEFDFHRTRLNDFPKSQILTKEEFNKQCSLSGLSFRKLIEMFKMKA